MVDTFLYLGDEYLNGPGNALASNTTSQPRTMWKGPTSLSTLVPPGFDAPVPSGFHSALNSVEINQSLPGAEQGAWLSLDDVNPEYGEPYGLNNMPIATARHYDCWWDGAIGGAQGNPAANGRFVPYHFAPASGSLDESTGEAFLWPNNPIGNRASPATNVGAAGWGNWKNYGGSCWYSNRWRWGPDVRLMRKLWERYYRDPVLTPTNPGFRFIKFAQPGGVGVGRGTASWAVDQPGWTAFLDQWNAAVDSEANDPWASGETLDVKCAFVDISAYDIHDPAQVGVPNLTFEQDVENFVAALRTLVGNPDLRIIWIAHATKFRQQSAPTVASEALNTLLRVARKDGNFRVIRRGNDPDTALMGAQGWANIDEPADPADYQTLEFLRIGEVMADTYDAMLNEQPAIPGTVIRGYIMLGSSQFVSGGLDWRDYGVGDDNPFHINFENTAAASATPLPPNARIWDGTLLSPYQPNANANPLHPDDPGPPAINRPADWFYGTELTFFERQVVAHQGEEIALLKVAVNGGALNTPEELGLSLNAKLCFEKDYESPGGTPGIYRDLLDQWGLMKAGVLQASGRTIDLQGIFVNLSDNEAPSQNEETAKAQANSFAGKLQNFLLDLRRDFATRIGDALVPIFLVNIHDGRIDPRYQAPRMNAAAHAIIKQAIRAAATNLPAVYQVEIEDLGPTRRDGVHYTGALQYELGRKLSELVETYSMNGGQAVAASSVSEDGADFLPGAEEEGAGGDGGVAVSTDISVSASPSQHIAAIDAALADGLDVASYTVNGRTVQLRSITELLTARRYYEAQLLRQTGLRRTRVSFN